MTPTCTPIPVVSQPTVQPTSQPTDESPSVNVGGRESDDGVSSQQAIEITVPIIVVVILLVAAIIVVVGLIVYLKYRSVYYQLLPSATLGSNVSLTNYSCIRPLTISVSSS